MKRTIRLFVCRMLPNYCVAAICCAYVFTIGWLTIRGRGALYLISGYFRCFIDYPPARIPTRAFRDLPWPAQPVTLAEAAPRDGNVTLLELLALVQATRTVAPRQIFEIGTFDGRTTLNMALNAPEACTVLTLDLPQDQLQSTAHAVLGGDKTFVRKPTSGARFQGTAAAMKIRQLFGDSATFDYAPYQGAIDLMFVDGAHAYDYVISDSRRALTLCRKSGSLIFWHDYGTWPDVTEALNVLFTREPEFAGLQHIEGTSLVYLIRNT
ncbi:MAG: class I SAM-dependent methyltransferase [Verrucomicrobia bacterium]|nr:class I SAM-dependent methyltransferase [Verrucomicrobiota bacterium]